MTLFVPLIDSRLAQGTAAGQMLYWDATTLRWLATDETKLKWDADTDVLTTDGLTVTSGLITGPGGNALSIGVIDRVISFTVEGAVVPNFQLANDNGSIGVLALRADATVIEFARAAETDIHCFHLADSGENPELRIYGFKTGDAVKYGSLMVDTGGDLVISAEEGVIISATGEVDITDIGTLTWGNGTTMAEDPGGITLVPSSTGIFTVTGDVDVSGSVTAAEYFGGSDIHLREDAITFGATNDSASIFLTPSAPGNAWIFCTDNVNVLQLILDSETIILDSAKNTGTPTLITRADDTFFNFKENTRTWLEASWDNRQIIFGEDIFHEQVALPVIFKDKNDGTFVEIDSFAGTIDMKGGITFDPTDGGNWPGAEFTISGDTIISDGYGLVIGHTVKITDGVTPELQVLGTGGADSSMFIGRWSADAFPPQLKFVKSLNPAIGSNTIVADDTILGGFIWYPDDGVDFATVAARWGVEVDDATPAAGDIGTAYVWEQMPGGGGAIAETMRLAADGTLSVQNDVIIGGDTYWVNEGSGLLFGSCYGNHIGWSQVNAVQNTWYNISDADMLDGPLHGVTHDGSGKLTVTIAGHYAVYWSCCFEDSIANNHVEAGIEVSGSGSVVGQGQGHLENKFANEEEHLGVPLLLDLAANATIEVAIRTTDAGTPTISVQAVNLVCMQIGGT